MTTTHWPSSGPRSLELLAAFSSLPGQFDDPLGYEAGDANLYRYVGNSPTNKSDPKGTVELVIVPEDNGWGGGGGGRPILGIDPGPGGITIPQYPPWPSGTGRCLTSGEKAALAPYISQVDLDNARLHLGEMPWFAPGWAIGITLGNDVYFRDRPTFTTPGELGELGHELQHVCQYRNGMTYLDYIWASLYGYDENPYEKEAYEKESEIVDGLRSF